MVSELGLPLAQEKTEGPATFLTFLGTELVTRQQTSKLPHIKLADLRAGVSDSLSKKKVALKELQEIVGHLNFAHRVVAPCRAFLQCLCSAMRGLK